MKRVPSTHFIKNIGKYLRGGETVVVTAHGADSAVLLPPAEYRRLIAAAAPPETPRPPPKESDPLAAALSIVSTSVPRPVSKGDLSRALKGDPKKRAVATIFFADVDARLLAGLVNAKHFTWRELDTAAARAGGIDDEKASFIRKMAGIELARAAGGRARLAP